MRSSACGLATTHKRERDEGQVTSGGYTEERERENGGESNFGVSVNIQAMWR